MDMPDENKKIFNDFEKKKKDISELRSILNQLNEEKERLFAEKDKTAKEIRSLVDQIREIKKKRNSLTAQVKELKAEKGRIVIEIKENIAESKKLKNEKLDFFKKHNIKGDPVMIKRQIESIETKIETEVISFDQEQKLMKKIKDLRAKAAQFGDVNRIIDRMNEISGRIDELKTREKELKKSIRKTAKDSQKEHEMMLELSKKIDELRQKEKGEYDKFAACKKQFTETSEKLKVLLPELGELKGTVNNIKIKKKKDKELKEKLSLDEKRNRVDEKIKKGEKLTTEDLLVFQNK